MNAVVAGGGDAPSVASFRHEALLYAGAEQFVARVGGFVKDSVAAGEPVMVAVVEPRASMLRDELGADARDVRFIDMENVGRNPARIIPAWQDWIDEQRAGGRAFRGVGEPVWAGRSPAEIVECQQHESLLNTAFDPGPGWWLVCPYDTASLDESVVDRAAHTHPAVLDGAAREPSAAYPHPELTVAAMFGDPLPEASAPMLYELCYTIADLSSIRHTVGELAVAAGMSVARSKELVLAVNELTTNTMLHGGGTGRLRLWADAGTLLAEVRDRGLIENPLVGRTRPPGTARGGAGMWMTNQLCDLVQIRSAPDPGTTVRIHMALSAA